MPHAAPIVGGLGLVAGLIENEKNRRAASEAMDASMSAQDRAFALQKQQFDLLNSIHQTLWNKVAQAEQAGQFSPEWQVEQAKRDIGEYESRDMGNLAGALRVAYGGLPGSEQGVRLDAVKEKYRNDLGRLTTGIRQQSIFNMLNAYNQTRPDLPATVAQGLGQQGMFQAQNGLGLAQYYNNRVQNPAGFFSALMPYLSQLGQKPVQQQPQPYLGWYPDTTITGDPNNA
ncbi:MAG: hypothetical protein JSS66_00190 [Armatimonadetes bacterium]|nr:hypothetical protein [Armatimonadota bacterium]